MDGSGSLGRLCPICDARVPPGARSCPSCSTDLSLFDVPPDAADAKIESKDNVDRILAELEKGEKDKALDGLKGMSSGRPAAPLQDGAGAVVLEVFQCPECGADVPSTANSCPKCGVMFESAQMYQCPLCNAVMDENATVCPGCGASFEPVEPEKAATSAQTAAQAPAVTQKEETQKVLSPIQAAAPSEKAQDFPPEASQAPMSFVERMKALKAQKDAAATGQPVKPAQQPATAAAAQPRPAAQQQAVQPHRASAPAQSSPGDAMRQLPALVAKIKDDFNLAKRLDIDVGKAKELINRAVTAGRERDLKAAVELVSQGELEVERAFTSFITKEIVALEKQAKDIQSSGIDASGTISQIAKARSDSAAKRWAESVTALDQARGTLNSIASEYFGAQKGLTSIKTIMEDSTALRIDLGEARTLYEECLKATVRRDWDTAKMLAEQCCEQANKVLPAYISNEMRKAKTKLLEVKMMNVSITKPVGHLKDANNQIKDGDYGAALHSIRQFKDAMAELER